jgi:hypothetical protein
MKKYFLLRDNQQSGTHSIEQLGLMGLYSLDLIWIENESTAWKYPEEIDELKSLIKFDNASQKKNTFSAKSDNVFVSLPSNFNQKKRENLDEDYSSFPVNEGEAVLETNYKKSLEELKENYRASKEKKPIWGKRIFPTSNAASVAAIFIGAVFGALVIKKMVDGSVPVLAEQTVAATPIIDREIEKQPEENYKNALVTEIVPVYKTAPAKTAKPLNVKKQLKIQANEYKVGLFGGINGLQLTVFNTSAQVVDSVIVAVDYLRPNGEVVQSENVAFSTIKPKGAQTISIPGSNRGVKVKYKILKVYAHNYKADLKQV